MLRLTVSLVTTTWKVLKKKKNLCFPDDDSFSTLLIDSSLHFQYEIVPFLSWKPLPFAGNFSYHYMCMWKGIQGGCGLLCMTKQELLEHWRTVKAKRRNQ